MSGLIVPAIALLALLAAPSYARAGGGHSVKVESSLAAAVDQLGAAAGPTGQLHVLVYGSNLASVNTALGLTPRNDLDVVGGESVTVPASTVDKLAAQSGVSYVAIDRPVVPTDTGTTSISADALATLFPSVDGAVSTWGRGFTGSGIGIAIIDSGVTPRADFGTRLVQVQLPAQDGTKLDDGVGHGSFVAGVAAGARPNGKYLGVAPGATVYAVNVAKADGVYTSDVVARLRWVLQHAKQTNIRVVNLSLSQTSPSQSIASTLDSAVEQLWKAGIVVVVSSGNLGQDSMLYAPGNDPFAI
ncbi:MAG: S8 family serine peptidase, partial [Gaiellaceae bacterium]